MGRGAADQAAPIEVQHRGDREGTGPEALELKTCSGPGGRDLYCDGFEHFRAETIPECCGNFLSTGECCGNAVPGEELIPVEECPHAAENARLHPKADSAADLPF